MYTYVYIIEPPRYLRFIFLMKKKIKLLCLFNNFKFHKIFFILIESTKFFFKIYKLRIQTNSRVKARIHTSVLRSAFLLGLLNFLLVDIYIENFNFFLL